MQGFFLQLVNSHRFFVVSRASSEAMTQWENGIRDAFPAPVCSQHGLVSRLTYIIRELNSPLPFLLGSCPGGERGLIFDGGISGEGENLRHSSSAGHGRYAWWEGKPSGAVCACVCRMSHDRAAFFTAHGGL